MKPSKRNKKSSNKLDIYEEVYPKINNQPESKKLKFEK